jgi:uncharacterized membrane protein
MRNQRILRNALISVSVLFALAQLLVAGTSDGVLSFSKAPLVPPQPTFITFDAPGATFTAPQGINAAGTIMGYYNDASGTTHGFVRASDGTISTFDGPNAIFGTVPYGINSTGVITGWYCDAIDCYGFLRAPDGSLTSFSVPGATYGALAVGINDRGVVTGGYADAAFNFHSFVRERDGTFETFDPAMSPNLSGIINSAGTITGTYFDDGGLSRSFVRDRKGIITIFDAPNVCETANGTAALGVNAAGLIVGVYWDADCIHSHGFVRSPNGAFTTIDVPGATDTGVYAINSAGAMSGVYFTDSGIFGFLRSPSGSFTTYSVPGFGFNSTALNPAGAIAGFYCDDTGCHGYLWTPHG